MKTKIAVLSNVNMNFVIRGLKKEIDVYDAEGYGNELGTLLNPQSSYHAYGPQMLFLLMDLMEGLGGQLQTEVAREKIEDWFATLSKALGKEICYISDAYLWTPEEEKIEPDRQTTVEMLWQKALEEFAGAHANVRIFPYRKLVEELGVEKAFSTITWRMGKIPHSSAMQKALGAEILHRVKVENRMAKKVLLLDLDNTLWGGLAGEHEITPIELSDEGTGLAYKNLQKVIQKMQKQGVVLGIVSKNNEADAKEILARHPDMVLCPEDFSIFRINWRPKHENIQEIAGELNLGLDSFVFFDDNPAERQLVKDMLPQVVVPDFPDNPEDLSRTMENIYREYFEKAVVTKEDMDRTRQYAENAKRQEMQQAAGSFEEYLKELEIVAEKVDPKEHFERLLQLVNKTNQFNLTTKRYTNDEMNEAVNDENTRVYLYRVTDKFGDNGIVVALIVRLLGEAAEIEEFTMSCRVMGRNIEHAIIDRIEKDLRKVGVKELRGKYIPTPKNAPVADLYPKLGYEICGEFAAEDGGVMYCRDITVEMKRADHLREKG